MRRSRNKFCSLLLLIIMVCAFAAFGANRALAVDNAPGADKSPALAAPKAALISPNGGLLIVEQSLEAKKDGQNYSVEFVIPQTAKNLRVTAPGHTVVRWSSTPAAVAVSSKHATRRQELEKEKNDLAAKLLAVKGRVAVWQAQTGAADPQQLERRQELMQRQMPELGERQFALERRLDAVTRELAEIPDSGGIGRNIEVELTGGNPDAKILLAYSYNLSSCGWTPVYDFDAITESGKNETVNVRLLAEVWQYTGMDWLDTEITLATQSGGPREPKPLRKWFVGGEEAKPAPQPRPHAASGAREAKTLKLEAAPAATAANAPVAASAEGVYAIWNLSARGLPEGHSRLEILSDTWQAPLRWLARPNTDDTFVWLMAKYSLPTTQAWPDGVAEYSLDGQSVGEGEFSPRGLEATLYFGADPRMSVQTSIDADKQGETGFINANKTWTGAWTYTLSNRHGSPIKVLVERPEPILGSSNMSVSYVNKPEAKIDQKEHMIYWEVEVPANGKTAIEHSVTISSPVKLPLFPDVP